MHVPLRSDHIVYELLGILIENRLDRNLHRRGAVSAPFCTPPVQPWPRARVWKMNTGDGDV